MLDPFQLPFMQRAALEIALLAPLAGLLGAQIVLRRLAFYTHAVGASAFPGLVLAAPLGLAPQLAALGVGGSFSVLLQRLQRSGPVARDATVALLLVLALATGVVLASDVFASGSSIDQLLFGSILTIGGGELVASAVALLIVFAIAARFRRGWIVTGFDGGSERNRPQGDGAATWALLGAVTIAAIVTLDAVGAMLVSSLLVIPAAIVRPHAGGLLTLEAGSMLVALLLGLAGLLLAYHLDVPPGAVTASLGAVAFLASLAVHRLLPYLRSDPTEAAGG